MTNPRPVIVQKNFVVSGSRVQINDTTFSGTGVVLESNSISYVEVENTTVTNSGTGSCQTGSKIELDSDTTTLNLTGC